MTVKTKDALQGASERLERLKTEKTSVSTSLKKQTDKSKRLERENQRLKAKKEARLAAEKQQSRLASQQVTVAHKQSNAVNVTGSCDSWIASAGISDVANARELISRESGCNPNAVNPSSGACGVAQELPCGKSGCSLGDGACQVKWMNQYVKGRYGSFAAAISFHNANNWY